MRERRLADPFLAELLVRLTPDHYWFFYRPIWRGFKEWRPEFLPPTAAGLEASKAHRMGEHANGMRDHLDSIALWNGAAELAISSIKGLEQAGLVASVWRALAEAPPLAEPEQRATTMAALGRFVDPAPACQLLALQRMGVGARLRGSVSLQGMGSRAFPATLRVPSRRTPLRGPIYGAFTGRRSWQRATWTVR